MNVWGKCTHLITTMVKLRLFFSHQPLPPCGGAHLRRTSAPSKHTITITLHNRNSPVTRRCDLCPPKNQTLPFILLHHPQQPNRQPANHQVARARVSGRLLGRLHTHRHQGDTRRQYHQCVALGCRQRPDTLADSPLSLSRVKFCCAWPGSPYESLSRVRVARHLHDISQPMPAACRNLSADGCPQAGIPCFMDLRAPAMNRGSQHESPILRAMHLGKV